MALAIFLSFLAASCAYALVDWRRGWFLVGVCGVLADPVRKITPGTPVAISFAVVGLYAILVLAARHSIIESLGDFARRFGKVYTAIIVFIFLLLLAALNGLFTYGFVYWRVPLLSFFTYLFPLLAALFGYAWLEREEQMYSYLRFYAAITSIALIGTVMEYLRVNSPLLGLVAFEGDYIRHLPGIQIRLLSGIYRSPDVMAWHAAMLTSIAIAFALRVGFGKQMLLWGGAAMWGFINCLIAGRRKAVYLVVVFTIIFLWRYMRRVRSGQALAIVSVMLLLAGVLHHIASDEKTSIYARGAATSQAELAQRFEGGALETLQQFGLMGAGLGTATQGVQHLLKGQNIGWQEGGIAKLAIEVGVPGILAILGVLFVAARLLLRLTNIGDVPGSTQFVRVLLFALVGANGAGFIASAQAYTDAVLGLTTGFLIGCLFATAALDEKFAAAAAAREVSPDAQPILA